MHVRHAIAAVAFSLTLAPLAGAQRPKLSNAVRQYVAVDTTIVALTHARVIDGTGARPRADQTLLIRDGRIAVVGPSSGTQIPAGALIMDLSGKSVIPGLVMVHEHLYYPTGPGVYGNLTESFSRLYLAGGVTSMLKLSISNAVLSPFMTVIFSSSADLYITSDASGSVLPSAGKVRSFMTKGVVFSVTPSWLCVKGGVDILSIV